MKSRAADRVLSSLRFVTINDLRRNVLGWFLDKTLRAARSCWSLYYDLFVAENSWSGPFSILMARTNTYR